MSLILIVSITIRVLAMSWSITLGRRIRDWRMGFLTLMLALMALRQILTLVKTTSSWSISFTAQATELPGLIVSILAFVVVISFEHIVFREKKTKEALARFAHQQSVVTDLSSQALAGRELQKLTDEAVRLTAEALGVEMCKIIELEESGESLRLVAGVGWREGLVGEATVGAGLDSQAGYTLHELGPVIVKDLRSESRFSGPPLLHDHEVVSGLSVPMVAGDFVFGVMGAHTAQRRDFSEDDIHFLEVVANVVTTAVLRKQSEEELRKHREQLEKLLEERTAELHAANKELESFSYSVSHDLRAPLRSIHGFSQLLLDDYTDRLDEQGKEYFQRICSASQRMGQMVDDLLNLSRVTRSEMRRDTVDLSALAQTIVAELQEAQPERQVEFVILEGVVVSGDPRLLRVVLENLLGNAWKFTGKRPRATIEFGVTQQDGEPAYYVRDDGAGFDMAYVHKLFGAFQRLHRRDEFDGTGVGLASVQRIVQRHGGEVWAEGEVDKGATFYFTL